MCHGYHHVSVVQFNESSERSSEQGTNRSEEIEFGKKGDGKTYQIRHWMEISCHTGTLSRYLARLKYPIPVYPYLIQYQVGARCRIVFTLRERRWRDQSRPPRAKTFVGDDVRFAKRIGKVAVVYIFMKSAKSHNNNNDEPPHNRPVCWVSFALSRILCRTQ